MNKFLWYKFCLCLAASIMLSHNLVAHHHVEHCHFNDLNAHLTHHHSHDHSDHNGEHDHPKADSFFHILSHLHNSAEGFTCVSLQSLLSENLRQFNLILPIEPCFSEWCFEVFPLLIQHSHFFDLFVCDPSLALNIGLRAPPVFID